MKNLKILKSYKVLADMLAASFGGKCEVVIHDLTTPQQSVVHVSNGCITNRQIGQSFDHLVKEVLLSKDFNNDYKANYTFELENGKKIKSSTSLIRDDCDEVIGAFCVNFEIEEFTKLHAFLEMFLADETKGTTEAESVLPQTFDNVPQIIDKLIDNTIGDVDVKKMKRSDNVKLLTFMHEKGIFLTKGAVEKVANKLQVSPVTVYSYLDEIKKKKAMD